MNRLLAAGDRAFDAGDFDTAIAAYRAALALDLDHPVAGYNLATALIQAGQQAAAIDTFRTLLARHPQLAEAAFQLGLIFQQANQIDAAIDCYRQAIGIRPDFVAAQRNLGHALRACRRYAEAITCFEMLVRLAPEDEQAGAELAAALTDQGEVLAGSGQNEAAAACYAHAVTLRPEDATARANLGNTYLALGRVEAAIAALEAALTDRPGDPVVQTNLGNALARAARHAEALEHYRAAIMLRPDAAWAWCNLGTGLRDLGYYDDAVQCFEQAVTLDAACAEAQTNLGMMALLCGDYVAGWCGYEWRLRRSGTASADAIGGLDDLTGASLLLTAEQGYGDTIQFARFIPLLADKVRNLGIQVATPLSALFAASFPEVALLPPEARDAKFDRHLPLMSVPFQLGIDGATIPATIPYLVPPRDACDRLSFLLPPPEHRRVGLVWAGGALYANDRNRSMPFATLAPLMDRPDVDFISLQKDLPAADRDAVEAASTLARIGERSQDFAETAAIIASLDLVISVDTAVAHLAGALARPVWIMIPYVPDWRWQLGRAYTPWYPTARLFRQTSHGDWSGVVKEVADALNRWMERGDAIALESRIDPAK